MIVKLLNKLLVLILLMFVTLYTNMAFSKDEYIVGIVPQFDQRKIFQIWTPILSELELLTGLKFKIVGSKKIPVFEKQYLQGKFDFAYVNPYFMLLGNKQQSYYPLVRDTGRKLYGIVVVRHDSPIQTIKQLNGEVVVFPSPNAVGASLIPRSDFINKYNIKISPMYVQTHTSVYLNVIQGRAIAGGGVQKTLEQQPQDLRARLRILYKTKNFNPHAFAAHSRIPKKHAELVLNALLDMGKTEKGKTMLRQIPMNKIGKAYIDDYTELDHWELDKLYVNE